MTQKTHHFDDSGVAYDATQCRENIKTGDILLIESLGVVGLAWTWPISVTAHHGKLHTAKDANADALLEDAKITREQARGAVLCALMHKFPIHPAFEHIAAEIRERADAAFEKMAKEAATVLEATPKAVYWTGKIGPHDDLGNRITNQFVDGRLKSGGWAILTPGAFRVAGVGKYGVGKGQRYAKQPDGRWLKVEG